MNYTSITLGELLSSENETIKRNAVSILKVLQKPICAVRSCTKKEHHHSFNMTEQELNEFRKNNH